MYNNVEIGARVKAKRKEVGMNQKAMAEALACSQPEVSNIERGERNFDDARVQKIASVLNCDVAYLTTGTTGTATGSTSTGTATA
jgi:transcriptional regulator with XRE-family HTH domain